MRVDEHAALLDAEGIPGALEHVAVAADIFADALVAAEAVADEIGGDRDKIAVAPTMRTLEIMRRVRDFGNSAWQFGSITRMMRWRMRSRSSAMMNSVRAVVAVGLVVGRHVVGGVVGEQRLPLVELPVVEQRGLVVEEILDLARA